MTATKKISSALSDLFFGYEHPNYESACSRIAFGYLDKSAILKDAEQFVKMFGDGKLIPEMAGLTADDLAENFMRRV